MWGRTGLALAGATLTVALAVHDSPDVRTAAGVLLVVSGILVGVSWWRKRPTTAFRS